MRFKCGACGMAFDIHNENLATRKPKDINLPDTTCPNCLSIVPDELLYSSIKFANILQSPNLNNWMLYILPDDSQT